MSRKVYVSPVPCGDGSGRTPENACALTEAFADARGGDFTLAEDSPARKIGFRPIDLTNVGIEGDSI